jgi:nitroreductase
MLAAFALGLGTCCIGSAVPALNTAEAKTEFGIPPDVDAIVPIIVGVPSEPGVEVPRKDPHILHWK